MIVDPTVRQAIEHRDRVRLKPLLHPYPHWTDGAATVRGRVRVLTWLATRPAVEPPIPYELRDGQIYRWTTGA
jgi:hypothetical protein